MKRALFIFLVAAALATSSVFQLAYASSGQDAKAGKVIAYYFHGTFRCPTCMTMEKYSKEAIETNFKDVFASGKLEFKAINVEERDNEHFVNDYQLYTKSLVLSLVKDGKEIKSKNLTKIWEYVRDKKRFLDYVSEEVNNFLKKAQ